MGDSFYTAWAEVVPDFSGFGKEVDKGFKKSMGPAGTAAGEDAGKGVQSGMLGTIGKLAGPLVAAFGALKLGELIGSTIADGIRQANDLEQTSAAIATVFGSAAGPIQQFASDAAGAFGITQQAALEASQMYGTYGKAAGLAGSDLSSFATDLTGLGADLAAFYGGDVQTALDAISAGLRGESEPLRQFGVLLDDATLKARAMALGIFDGTGSLTQQQRVLAAQAEILAQTTDAQGQAAAEANSFDGQLKRLSAGWESVVTTIGQLFLPIATQLVSFLNQYVLPAVTGLFTSLNSGDTSGFFALLGPVGDVLSPIIAAVAQLAPAFLQLWAATSPIAILFKAIQPLLPTIAGLFSQVAEIVGGVLTEVLGTILPPILELVSLLASALQPILQVVMDLFIAILGPVLELASTIIGALMPVIKGLLDVLGGLIEFVVGVFSGDWDKAFKGLQRIFQGFVDAVGGLIDGGLKLLFEGIPKFIGDIFKNVGTWLVDAGKALIQGFIDGIMGTINLVGDAIGGVMDFIGGFFPRSPAKRGQFSGAGWRAVEHSGSALYDQFMGGFGGDEPSFPPLGGPRGPVIPRPAQLDDVLAAATSPAGGLPRSLKLIVGAREFDAYVREESTVTVRAAAAPFKGGRRP